jgi:tetratricopeptide (TPR) repeat protein
MEKDLKREVHAAEKPTLLGKLVVFGLYLTLLLPLLVLPSLFFPFITGRNFFFRIVTEVVFLLYMLDTLLHERNRPRMSVILAALLAFTMLLGLSAWLGADPARSFFSNFERMEGLITFLHLLAWFMVAAGVLRTLRQWESFFRASLLVSAAVTGFALLQLLRLLPADQERIGATLGNPIFLSYYLYFNIFLCLFFFFKQERLRWRSLVYPALFLLQFLVLLKAATRGVLLGFLLAILVAMLVVSARGRRRSWQRRSAVALVSFLLVAAAAFFALKDSEWLKQRPPFDRFARISFANLGADTERVVVWKMAWQGIRERPLLGWGQENFPVVFARHYDARMAAREQWYDRAHNTYLEWWLAGGIVGLAAYLGIFAAAFFTLARLAPAALSLAEKAVLTGALAGYMLINFFDFDNLTSYLSFFAILAFLHSLAKEEETPPPRRRTGIRSQRPLHRALCILVLAACAAAGICWNRAPMLSLLAVSRALAMQQEGPAQNLADFRKALAYGGFGREEIMRQLTDKALQISLADSAVVDDALKRSFVEAAREEMVKMAKAGVPGARLELSHSELLNRVGRHEEALEHLGKAERLFPGKPAILVEKTVALLSLKRYDEALNTARKAFDLNPGYQESRKFYALCAICNGDLPLAESLLLPVFHTLAVDDDRFILAYSLSGQWRLVIQIYSDRLSRNPADLDSRIGLAQAFLRTGEKKLAVEQIEAAIRFQPAFREQGLKIIMEIINSGPAR